ncbi:hypothetical protein AVEN_67237-1 [Araneus ventricosus]|uniref:Uncharacterized protein n=1 Tax=Araneus ventricosus TaxID=182803 RepID=A0A4Y2T5J7_ARAVE|nr:hypothetical protein AVEN_67237-1 [Araneus ventricosus]
MKQGQEDLQYNILNVISTKVDAIVEKNEERLGKVEGKFDTIEDKVNTILQNLGILEQETDKLKIVQRIPEDFDP